MAPEIMEGKPILPSGDVYSIGFLIHNVLEHCPHPFLMEPLTELSYHCGEWDPKHRPSLNFVAESIMSLTDQLSSETLSEKLAIEE